MTQQSAPLETQGKTATSIKAIGALILGVIVGIFGAGAYWSQLQTKIDTAYEFAIKNKDLKTSSDAGLRESLKQWGNLGSNPKASARSGPGGGSFNADSMCEAGFYAVGVKTMSNTGPQCNGCLTSVTVECRPLKTD